MAKTIKFNLICDGKPVRTLEDLRNNFSIEDIVDYFNNKLLQRWLSVRGYNEELEKVEGIQTKDTLELVKELVTIFEVDNDPVSIEENTYILQYKKEREFLMVEYEKTGYNVSSIIQNYHLKYWELVKSIIENKDDIAQIKATIREIDKEYHFLYELNYRELFYKLLGTAPIAIFVMLMNENMRGKYLPLSAMDEDNNVTCDIDKDSDKKRMYECICDLIKDNNSLAKILGKNLKEFAGATDGYWKDVETRDKKYMILKMESNNFIRSAGVSGGDLSSSDINNNFVILEGIDYKSNNALHKLLYMEV